MEIIPALPAGPSILPVPCLLHGLSAQPGLLKVQLGKQLGFHISALLCKSLAPCGAGVTPQVRLFPWLFFFLSGAGPAMRWPRGLEQSRVPVRSFTPVEASVGNATRS